MTSYNARLQSLWRQMLAGEALDSLRVHEEIRRRTEADGHAYQRDLYEWFGTVDPSDSDPRQNRVIDACRVMRENGSVQGFQDGPNRTFRLLHLPTCPICSGERGSEMETLGK